MIQRIQSLFLFLSFIACILCFIFPIATFWSEEGSYEMFITGLNPLFPGEASFSINTLPLSLIAGITAILSLLTIFLYKKRMLQMKIIRFGIMLCIVLVLLILFFYVPEIEELTKVEADYLSETGIYFPLAALILLLLANRFIRKDEKMIRAADRLR
jgi:magnesium-transporting ATPase (P-type)